MTRIILTRPRVEAGERLASCRARCTRDRPVPASAARCAARHDGSRGDPEADAGRRHRGRAAGVHAGWRTLNDAFIILDEAQNTTAEQMKMFLTRLGFGSKIVVTGDITQVDLPGGARSGLRAATEILGDIDGIHFAVLDSSDVVRPGWSPTSSMPTTGSSRPGTGISRWASGTAAGGPAALAPAVGLSPRTTAPACPRPTKERRR